MKISISINECIDNIEIANYISKLIGCSIATAKNQLKKGKLGVFYTTELFLNDYSDRAKEILEIINYFNNLNIQLYIIEIAYNESWESVDLNNLDKYRIEESVLKNTIMESIGQFK